MNTRTLVAALVGLALVAAACGSDEPAATEPATTGTGDDASRRDGAGGDRARRRRSGSSRSARPTPR